MVKLMFTDQARAAEGEGAKENRRSGGRPREPSEAAADMARTVGNTKQKEGRKEGDGDRPGGREGRREYNKEFSAEKKGHSSAATSPYKQYVTILMKPLSILES